MDAFRSLLRRSRCGRSCRWARCGCPCSDRKETEALTQYEQALALYRLCGNEYAEARALNAIGEKLAFTGRASEALPYCTQALAVMSDVASARSSWRRALEIMEGLGHQNALAVRAKLTP